MPRQGEITRRLAADPLRGFGMRYVRQIVLPIVALIALTLGVGWFGLLWTADQFNRISAQHQVEATRRALNNAIDELAYQQQSVAQWTLLDAVLHGSTPDQHWLHANVGRRMRAMFGHDATLILNGDDRPVYASIEGKQRDPRWILQMMPQLQPLIDGIRGRLPGPGNAHSRRSPVVVGGEADSSGNALSAHESDVVLLGGRPAAASAMPVGEPGRRGGPARPFILLTVQYLDQAYLGRIARQDAIDGLRFSVLPRLARDEKAVPLDNGGGHRLGYFIWTPHSAAREINPVLITGALGLLATMVTGLAWLALSLWRSGRQLADAMLQLQASEAQAHHMALHDALTGLPNRALFENRLDRALARARRGRRFAILALDLDRFKQVNDTYGHPAGDALIREVAHRLCVIARANDTVARLGGDEFVLLLDDVGTTDQVDAVCDRICAAVTDPFDLLGNRVFVGVSIGVAIIPDTGTERTEVLRKADLALYRAKSEGRNCRRYFEPEMDDDVKLRSATEDELRSALADGRQLRVHFQPEMDTTGRRAVGVEALVRWEHPVRGLLGPDHFIGIAEDAGLIGELGDWVIEQACGFASRWPELFVAVNVSPVQMRNADFAPRVAAIVARHGCRPAQIEFEITENLLIEDAEIASVRLAELRALGFRVALDDFGTGYSSLSHLQQFEVDKIKIDRSFTENLDETDDAAAIVTAVVTLGHAMGLRVTAEGVETKAQWRFLAGAGCDELQGYLFCQALPETDLVWFLRGATRRDAA